jgi:NHL repeat
MQGGAESGRLSRRDLTDVIWNLFCCDADGWVYVADRENHRVQVFDGNGSSRRNGRTCTARVAFACPMAINRFSTSAKSGLPLP